MTPSRITPGPGMSVTHSHELLAQKFSDAEKVQVPLFPEREQARISLHT